MKGRVNKARPRRPRANPSKAPQQALLDAVAADQTPDLPQSQREQSHASGHPARDAGPRGRATRRLEAAAKWSKLTRKATPEAEKADQTAQQSKVDGPKGASPSPRPLKRPAEDDGPRSHGNESQPPLKRARLTRRNLAVFDKMTGKKAASNSKGGLTMMPSEPSTESSTKTLSTTASGFAVRARKNGILDLRSSKPPANLEDIRQRHARTRETASPEESAFRSYVRTVDGVRNEATMVFETGRYLLKSFDPEDHYKRSLNQAFTAVPKNAGFNNGLSAPQPDLVEGLEMDAFRPFPVDEHVSGAVLYKDDPYSLTLPHLAGEWKGPEGSTAEATLQAGYDGAALVYGRNQALSLMGKSDPPGHAAITTFTTDGSHINFFAHYAAPSAEEEDTIEYHQYQYATAHIKESYQGHRDGRRGLRNEQDYAKDQSYALRDQLKDYWKQRRGLYPVPEVEVPPPAPQDMPIPSLEQGAEPYYDIEAAEGSGEEELPPPPPPTKSRRAGKKDPQARGTAGGPRGEAIDGPSYAPTPPQSSGGRRRSTRLSTSRQLSGGAPGKKGAKGTK